MPCCGQKKKPKVMKNAATAAAKVITAAVTGQKILVDRELRQKRLSTCKNCNYINGERCELCGCFVRIKTMLVTEVCPRNLWLESDGDLS